MEHEMFKDWTVDEAKLSRLYESHRPNPTQLRLCEKLNVPPVLWSAFKKCLKFNESFKSCMSNMPLNVLDMRGFLKLMDQFKHDVRNYDFSEYAEMDLTDTEKLFIITHKKIPLKRMITTDCDDMADFEEYVVLMTELYIPFYNFDGDLHILMDNMRREVFKNTKR